ncbi:MAG: hypothetical protein JRD49_01295 [Deltaproteobacteria bacterium]|nr:hypothetical protein [Deltaproteobacteria bacterium]MBW2676175.1 hypothetical protein [Deltaproteobacteria bacterium]
MVKKPFVLGFMLVLLFTAHPLMADDSAADSPWAKFSLHMGAFLSTTNTDARFGSGIGLSVDLEEALGLDVENRVFRMEGSWRFTDNRRHRLDLSWFSLYRSGEKTVTDEIIITPPGGGEDIEIAPGTEVKSFFDMDIYQLNYSYSFIQDERLDFGGQVGLYIMPISFGLSVTGLIDEEADQSFVAPLPVVGLRFDVLIAPKWYLRSGSQFFYIQYEGFTGSLVSFKSAIEYNPWKHVGFGLGVDSFRMQIEADGKEYVPEFDLRGNVQFGYAGVMLYGRVFF